MRRIWHSSRAIFQHYQCIDNDTPLRVIVPFLKEHPEIVQLNAFRHQDWAANQKLKTKLILKKTGLL